MPITLEELPSISEGDTEKVSVSFKDHLDSGELLTGTPTVVEVTTTDLTLGSKQVNTTAYTDKWNASIAIGQAVQFSVTGGSSGTTYTIRITVSTDAAIARTFVRDIKLKFE